MKNIVMLGAGAGGALAANLLSHRIALKEWTITVIDRASLHIYQPGLLFIPFGMYGYQSPDDVVRPIVHLLGDNTNVATSKAGLVAHFEAETVVESLLREIDGEPPLPAHMTFIGKDLNTAPQIRVARAMCVKDVMSKDVVTVRQGTSLPVAAELMVAKKVSGLPVIDAEERLVGILTEGDFLSAMNIDGGMVASLLESIVRKRSTRKGMGTIVDDIMTRSPITIRANDTLEAAVKRMDRNKVKRLVVTGDDHRVHGIVSRADLIKIYAMK
jgi:CBS domain-containing protein